MPTTTNFGWTTPADTDLVKDGAAAIRTALGGVDTSFVDLKGGTTGQVLSKTSNTDLDFTWVAQDDSNAIQNALLTTTGDTIYASAASTPARLGLGTAGQVLTVNSGATAPEWATPAAGGGMTLIATANPSGATTISFTSIPTTYKQLYLFWNLYHSSATEYLYIRLNNDTSSNYEYSGFGYNSGTATFAAVDKTGFGDSRELPPVNYSNNSTEENVYKGFMTIQRANEAVSHIVNWQSSGRSSAPAFNASIGNGIYTGSAAAISRLDFIRSGTQTITGTVSLYGVN